MPSVDEMLAQAIAAAPACGLAPADLAARVDAAATPELLAGLRLEDLALALGCARGAPAALAALEGLLGEARAALARAGVSPEEAEETLQRMRCDLLVAAPGEEPGILAYGGRGRLGAWLRVIAVRTAVKSVERGRRCEALDEDLLEAIAPGRDVEVDALRALYGGELKAAFAAALAALAPRQRNLLRHHLIDHLSIDDLGRLLRVHRATAARWLVAARDELIERTRAAMMAKLGVGAADLESILRLVRSECDLSISRLLAHD